MTRDELLEALTVERYARAEWLTVERYARAVHSPRPAIHSHPSTDPAHEDTLPDVADRRRVLLEAARACQHDLQKLPPSTTTTAEEATA